MKIWLFLGLILLSANCAKRPTLKGVAATITNVESSVTTTAAGTVVAEHQAILSFGAAGRVARIHVSAGNQVEQGDLIAELENRDLKTTVQDAERELKRARALFKSGLVSRATLDDAVRNFEVARANYDKTVIRAPFSGIVTEMNLELGELASQTSPQWVGSTQPAAKAPIRLVDRLPRLIRGDIDEIDLPKVKVGTVARVRIQALGKQSLPAQVTRVVPFVSTVKEKDRTSEVELKVTAPDVGLLPVGASVDIELITATKSGALAIPNRTVLGHGAQRYVFRYADGKAQRVNVKLGIGNYERTEITEGLKAGDVVIFPPEELELKDGMRVNVETSPWP